MGCSTSGQILERFAVDAYIEDSVYSIPDDFIFFEPSDSVQCDSSLQRF